MVKISECHMNNLCVDCDNDKCYLAGEIISDCPKYHCDRDKEHLQDCKSCDFIKEFQESERKRYERKEGYDME